MKACIKPFWKIFQFQMQEINLYWSFLTILLIPLDILIKNAKENKISCVSSAISPLIFPQAFSQTLQKRIFSAKMIPHVSLSGIDSGILDNAKEIGMEKYLDKINKLPKMKFSKFKTKSIQKKKSDKRIIKVKLGPNNIHTILDSLEIEH